MRKADGFFQLSSESRQDIIQTLLESPKRHTEISRILDMTPGEVTRNLQRLTDAFLVSKGSDTKYYVTNYGQLLNEQLVNIDFFERNNSFFDSHDMSVIPPEMASYAVMAEAEVLRGTPRVMSEMWSLTAESGDFIHTVFETPLKPLVEENVKMVKKGVSLKGIIPISEEVPGEYVGVLGVQLEIKKMNSVCLYLKVNEKAAILGLPDIDGHVDYAEVLFSTHPGFINWARLLFNFYWERAGPSGL